MWRYVNSLEAQELRPWSVLRFYDRKTLLAESSWPPKMNFYLTTKPDSARFWRVNDTLQPQQHVSNGCSSLLNSLFNNRHTLKPILQVMNVENESILLRRMEFFHQCDIEVWLRKEVSRVWPVLLMNSVIYKVNGLIHNDLNFKDHTELSRLPLCFTGTVGGRRQENGHIWRWFSPELWSASHLNWLQVQTNTQSPSHSGAPSLCMR